MQENFEFAFSDNDSGWAYYSKGALRHNSNSEGEKYGEPFGSGDVVGCLLDTIEGTMSFSKNGMQYGVAWKDKAFQTD